MEKLKDLLPLQKHYAKNWKSERNIQVYQNFQRIEAEIIEVNCDDLSTDQKYLLEIHCAISKGIVDHSAFIMILVHSSFSLAHNGEQNFASLRNDVIFIRKLAFANRICNEGLYAYVV